MYYYESADAIAVWLQWLQWTLILITLFTLLSFYVSFYLYLYCSSFVPLLFLYCPSIDSNASNDYNDYNDYHDYNDHNYPFQWSFQCLFNCPFNGPFLIHLFTNRHSCHNAKDAIASKKYLT